MPSYILKPVVAGRIYDIRVGGSKIGNVRKLDTGKFLAFTTGKGPMNRAEGFDAREAFEALVTILNRISLCGENDAAKAREALAERNARTEAANARHREEMKPLIEAFEHVLGTKLPERRPRYTKIRI